MALAASALVLSACSSGSTTSASSESASAASSVSTSAPAHDDADVAFAQGMIPHHRQAVEMSDMLLGKQGVDPAVVSLAEEIKAAQAPEIETMQGWLQQWGAPAAPVTTGAPGHDMSGHDMAGMGGAGHGMMSDADMAALQNAPGPQAGRLFLDQMIQHHEGAIAMAQQEIDDGRFPEAVDMARNIVTSQRAEIDAMRELRNG